jgi:hypothetical protein
VGEEGVDAGGLTKEWFQLLIRDLFSTDYGMFIGGPSTLAFTHPSSNGITETKPMPSHRSRTSMVEMMGEMTLDSSFRDTVSNTIHGINDIHLLDTPNDTTATTTTTYRNLTRDPHENDTTPPTKPDPLNNGYIWFNPAVLKDTVNEFYMVGIILGLAIYNSSQLDTHFPDVVYRKLLNYPVGLMDLKQFRPVRSIVYPNVLSCYHIHSLKTLLNTIIKRSTSLYLIT